MKRAEYIIPLLLIVLTVTAAAASTYLFPKSEIKTVLFTDSSKDAFAIASLYADTMIEHNQDSNNATISLNDPIKLSQLEEAGAIILTPQQEVQCLNK